MRRAEKALRRCWWEWRGVVVEAAHLSALKQVSELQGELMVAMGWSD